MITNNYVALREWFYPFGNTPAVNLLRDVPLYPALGQDKQNVELLLLGCGDPRNILFSLFCQDGRSTTSNFNFTCCDYEAAVLARNIILLTLIADEALAGQPDKEVARSSTLWNIFYHMYIPPSDLTILQKQSRKLTELAMSPDSWSSSTYGKWIRFLDEDTRSRVSDIWSRYSKTENFSEEEAENFEVRARQGFANMYNTKISSKNPHQANIVLHGTRCGGSRTIEATCTLPLAFERYWKTGVVGGNRKDIVALGKNRKGRVNPMLAISSASNGDFALHYGSDPLLGFHVAEAFDKAHAKNEDIETVVAVAKSEFRKWCSVFSRCLAECRVQITLFYGEAVRLCYEMQARIKGGETTPNITRLYKNVWSSTCLQINMLDNGGQIPTFDVIDTSNLVDHVGILNVLPAATPLLSRHPSSIIYTESLLVAAEDLAASLSSMLCSNVDTLALMLGLAPVGHLTGVSSDSYASEVMLLSVASSRSTQFRMRVAWKIPGLGDPKVVEAVESDWAQHPRVNFDAEPLAQYFFNVYLKMFEHEDWSKAFSRMGPASVMRQLTSPLAGDLRYYTRLSLVKLMHMAKSRITSDWQACMDSLLQKIESNRTIVIGMNSVQELRLHMHTFGLWKDSAITCQARDLGTPPYGMFVPNTSDTGLLGQPDVPSVVFVALVVPRGKLSVFTDETPDTVGTPCLHLSIQHGVTSQNSFHAVQCFFGQLVARGPVVGTCDVEEDGRGWSGRSDLIVVCQIPLYSLLLGPRKEARVALVVNTTPSNVQFTMKLGFSKSVFETGLSDRRRVWLLKEAPTVSSSIQGSAETYRSSDISSLGSRRIHVNLDAYSSASSLQIRTEFAMNSPESHALKHGANVTIRPDSACTLLLDIKGCPPLRLTYHYPINATNSRTKIARRSSWIEVTVPISGASTSSGYKTNPFVVGWNGNNAYWSCALPWINLVQQPVIRAPTKSGWVNTFVSMAMSERERDLNRAIRKKREQDALFQLKESLHLMFSGVAGEDPQRGTIKEFQLILRDRTDCDTIILASGIRYDHDSSSVVLDAYVTPLTSLPSSCMDSSLLAFKNADPLSVGVSAEEELLWKYLLPAAAERCRTWSHKRSCEYNRHGCVPLSTTHGQNPLCSCGEGEMSEDFPNPSIHGAFREYATRVAIPVLFAVPYAESVISKPFGDLNAFGGPSSTTSTHQARTQPTAPLSKGGSTKCDKCGAVKDGLRACVRCGKVRYCNHACQKADWKDHKKVCGKKTTVINAEK